MFLKKHVQHSAVLVHCTPQPVLHTLDLHANFVQVPKGTTSWFPVPQFLGDGGAKFLVPVTDGFMTNLNSSLEKKFFNVSVAEGEAVIQLNGVLDDTCWETMAVRLWVSRHDRPAYPKLT